MPVWTVWLIRFQFFVVYFYGAIAKLNADWLVGEPMLSQIPRGGSEIPEIAHLLSPTVLAYFIAYSGILVDAVVPILFLIHGYRRYAFAVAFLFHLLNLVFLNIGMISPVCQEFSHLHAGYCT